MRSRPIARRRYQSASDVCIRSVVGVSDIGVSVEVIINGNHSEELLVFGSRVWLLIEIEYLSQNDIKSRSVVIMATAVPIEWFLIEPTAGRLAADGSDALVGQNTLNPRQHQFGVNAVRIV